MSFIKIVSTKKHNRLKEKYKALRESYEELSKAFEATEHCCPYDNEKCTKTNCFVVGGECARRSKKYIYVYHRPAQLKCHEYTDDVAICLAKDKQEAISMFNVPYLGDISEYVDKVELNAHGIYIATDY